jgi:tRNA dimethylallyltransferase
MQVYWEFPTITNQARRRLAELVGIVSVTEDWTVARHKARAEEIIAGLDAPFVLDAGTGMYLNAILLGIPLAPKVEAGTRHLAQEITAGASNPRRASRAKELELAGAPERDSIWDGALRYDTTVLYLRPSREVLDTAIAIRSQKIVREGLEEAANLKELVEAGAKVNASVMDSIGVRELLDHLDGETTIEAAENQIATRTRQLARRQVRWFDKLGRTLRGRADITVAEGPSEIDLLNCMYDRMRT